MYIIINSFDSTDLFLCFGISTEFFGEVTNLRMCRSSDEHFAVLKGRLVSLLKNVYGIFTIAVVPGRNRKLHFG